MLKDLGNLFYLNNDPDVMMIILVAIILILVIGVIMESTNRKSSEPFENEEHAHADENLIIKKLKDAVQHNNNMPVGEPETLKDALNNMNYMLSILDFAESVVHYKKMKFCRNEEEDSEISEKRINSLIKNIINFDPNDGTFVRSREFDEEYKSLEKVNLTQKQYGEIIVTARLLTMKNPDAPWFSIITKDMKDRIKDYEEVKPMLECAVNCLENTDKNEDECFGGCMS